MTQYGGNRSSRIARDITTALYLIQDCNDHIYVDGTQRLQDHSKDLQTLHSKCFQDLVYFLFHINNFIPMLCTDCKAWKNTKHIHMYLLNHTLSSTAGG